MGFDIRHLTTTLRPKKYKMASTYKTTCAKLIIDLAKFMGAVILYLALYVMTCIAAAATDFQVDWQQLEPAIYWPACLGIIFLMLIILDLLNNCPKSMRTRRPRKKCERRRRRRRRYVGPVFHNLCEGCQSNVKIRFKLARIDTNVEYAQLPC